MKKEYYRPLVFTDGKYAYHRDNQLQQNLLLRALQTTTDPERLKEMTGIKTMAEVYRTLNKLAIRKEYHAALVKHGLDLDTIVGGIAQICKDGKSDAIKLKGYQTILRSLGLANYDDDKDEKGKDWEDKILEIMEKGNAPKLLVTGEEYEVRQPVIDKEDQIQKQKELEEGRSIYE